MTHLSRNSFNFVKPTNSSIQVDGKSTFLPFLWIARYMFKFQKSRFLALSNLCIQNSTLCQQIVAVCFVGIGKQSISKSLSPTIATNNSSNVSHREIRPFVCVRLPTYATVSQLLYVLAVLQSVSSVSAHHLYRLGLVWFLYSKEDNTPE